VVFTAASYGGDIRHDLLGVSAFGREWPPGTPPDRPPSCCWGRLAPVWFQLIVNTPVPSTAAYFDIHSRKAA
jgi:hypothetical protein